jgi:sulfate adenylyltransferase subunit 2
MRKRRLFSSLYSVEVQIGSSAERVRDWIASHTSGSLSLLAESLGKAGHTLSSRQISRLVAEVFGDALTGVEEIRDAEGRALNPLVAEAWDKESRSRHLRVFFGQIADVDHAEYLVLTDRRGERVWGRIQGDIATSMAAVRALIGKDFWLVPHGSLQARLGKTAMPGVSVADFAHRPLPFMPQVPESSAGKHSHRHLAELEAESIRIIREAVAVAKKPGMLFSMGKDSMVMWTLAKKAFWPEPVPFPLVIIDTRWKFQEMYRFRHWVEGLDGTETIVHINPDAIARDVNPFDFGSATHTEITKTQALKQILDTHQFDFVFGGARRDEERSRAKERVFSLRNERHGWDPRNQRPELWNLYNTTLLKGQSMRVFPLSNWTELDIWRYIEAENIPLVPLYFSKTRPFVERDGALIMVDDERFRLQPGERIRFEPIRFRTLGCYPLTGGVRSVAHTVSDIVAELERTRVSERSSRVIDFDPGASMEQKKKEGYF